MALWHGIDHSGSSVRLASLLTNEKEGALSNSRVDIQNPLWASWWAIILYGLGIIALLMVLWLYERRNFMLIQKAKTAEEIDKAKSEFFVNISHELRTPLTLILGPLKTLQQGSFKGNPETLFSIISQNGGKLLHLVDQLLDLSKLDQDLLKLNLKGCYLNELIRQVIIEFEPACAAGHIELEFLEEKDPVYCQVDHEKLKQVIHNLISNAVKFTGEGGHIQVTLDFVDHSEGAKLFQAIEIAVRDSGFGIAKAELDYIFDRFYKVKRGNDNELNGSGIGLTLAQKLVQLHQGRIEVESEQGLGSTFTVTLPYIKIGESTTVNESPPQLDHMSRSNGNLNLFEPSRDLREIVLIVDQNVRTRNHIRASLGEKYQYLEASNGVVGLEIAETILPDLILSNILIPGIDGYAFCRKIRSQPNSRHIAFIFLSLGDNHSERLRGLGLGSNDFVLKPFNKNELVVCVNYHLDRMKRMRTQFINQLSIQGDIQGVESMDKKFVSIAIMLVQQNLNKHDLTDAKLAEMIGMNQSQLCRKLTTLTGLSTHGFIQGIRLKQAAQLILQDNSDVKDVASAVGFNDLSDFVYCFTRQFGIPPETYGKKSMKLGN